MHLCPKYPEEKSHLKLNASVEREDLSIFAYIINGQETNNESKCPGN